MSSSAINSQVAQIKVGNVQNQGDSSAIYNNGDWSFKNATATATNVFISNAGNVGIGTSSPNSQAGFTILHVGSVTTSGLLDLTRNGAQQFRLFCSGADAAIRNDATSGNITFTTKDSGGISAERMRIDASGNLLVGRTTRESGEKVSILGVGGNDVIFATSPNGATGLVYKSSLSTGTAAYFITTVSGTGVEAGKIQISGGSTTYATSSDYRLKEDVKPMVAALSKVAALKPCTYKWKIDGSEGEGFIAHELAEVCPLAVVGEKDAVNEDGLIKPQGIDPSKLIALLTAAIQELSAKNEALEARLAALEAK